jgi:SNF2 family DNA or RNA helicase
MLPAIEIDIGHLRHLAEKDLGVPTRLHDYQWDGVAFLFRSSGALLADDMGLGKTVQTAVALALLLQGRHPAIRRAIIVTPASLTLNWQREIEQWTPSITARRVMGDARSREAYYLLPIPVLIASYEQVRFDALDRIPTDAFDLVVLDEAQRIKNSDSATAFACRLLPRSRAWALSATPLENNEGDVASILRFLSPSLGSPVSRSRLRGELAARMLRRRKVDVRAELPPVILQDLELELSARQRDAYDELWFKRSSIVRESATEDPSMVLLALITRLKILCNFERVSEASSKLDALRAFIEGAGDGARILVFSQFVETLEWISRNLTVRHELLTGSMTMEARYRAIAVFKEGATPRALLISLRAGGVGLNLGDATHVVLFDRWWNPAVEIQAIYRAHRFERDSPLHVVRFVSQDTIEERIAQILEHKRELFKDVVDSVDSPSYHFTREELLRILELGPEDLPRPSMQRR